MRYFGFITISLALTASSWEIKADEILPVTLPNHNQSKPAVTSANYPKHSPPKDSTNRDIVGDTVTIGTTWYESQHHGTTGRMVDMSDDGFIHFVWMNGIVEQATIRHIYYNFIDTLGNQCWPGTGYPVESSYRAGYATVDVGYGGIAFPTFHWKDTPSYNFHPAVAVDFFPHCGAFLIFEPDWLYISGNDIPLLFPKMQMDRSGRIHVVSTEEVDLPNVPMRQYYTYGTYNPALFSISFPPSPDTWTEISYTQTIAADVAASRVSDRVAIGWTYCRDEGYPGGNPTQYNNDIWLFIDDDGQNFNFYEAFNLTQFIPPDTSLLPDTTAANMDTLRAYTDMSLFFDYNDFLHIAFTTIGYYQIQGLETDCESLIWHWSEQYPDAFFLVADGWYPGPQPGVLNRNVQRPSLSMNPNTGYLYCMYQQYDTSTTSAFGYPSGEVCISVSTDGGATWSIGTNITNTISPQGAIPGQCLSELTPTMADTVDDDCHIMYVLDRDAGFVLQGEGTWTFNPVKYHKVPTSSIPTLPLMHSRPFHVSGSWGGYITVNPNTLNFGDIPVLPQTIPTLPFYIIYVGPDSAYVNDVVSSSPHFRTNFPTGGLTIYPFIPFEVVVSFIPEELMAYACTLMVYSDLDTASVWANGLGVQPLDIGLTLIGPQVIPETGGALSYEIELDNQSIDPYSSEIWMNIELPSGVQFTTLGPLAITIPGAASLSRLRSQNVPGLAPSGDYMMYAMIGEYPWTIDDLDTLTFSKAGNINSFTGEFNPADWANEGEPFEDWFTTGNEEAIPGVYSLGQNYPNPFNPLTTINFSLPEASYVKLAVYDLMGRQVTLLVNGNRQVGTHQVTFRADALASGVYLYRIEAGNFTAVRKLVVIK